MEPVALRVRPPGAPAGTGTSAPFAEGAVAVGGLEVVVAVTAAGGDGDGLRVDWSVRNPGREPARLGEVGLTLSARYDLVLEHGWQSWSAVRRCRPGDVRPERRDCPEWRRRLWFADGERAGRVVTGEPFLLTDGGVAGFLDGRRNLGLVEAGAGEAAGGRHSAGDGQGAGDGQPAGGGQGGALTAWALLDGVALAPCAERVLEPLWVAAGDPGRRYSEFARRWGAEAGARACTPAPTGWCSWYHYRSSVTPADVRANLAPAAAHGLEVVQVDDGYQSAVGDWLAPAPAWSEGTAAAAAGIAGAGLRPGIWTAPFLAAEGSRVAAEHSDWVLGRAMHNPVWWGGWALALDPTHPGVLDHVTTTLAALTAQGFTFHKVDFLYAGAVLPPRAHPSRTRAEALRLGLDAVRRGVGDGAFVLGCGAPFGPAVGVVDAMRVSPDVAPWWEPRQPPPGMTEAASSARTALATSVLRAPLHRRLWANDADCLLLRPAGGGLDRDQRRQRAGVVAGAGGYTFVSDDLAGYGEEEWAELEAVRAAGREGDGPLDLEDPFAATLTVRPTGFHVDPDGA